MPKIVSVGVPKAALIKVLDYVWDDEERHYEQEGGIISGNPHIFNSIDKLGRAINYRGKFPKKRKRK